MTRGAPPTDMTMYFNRAELMDDVAFHRCVRLKGVDGAPAGRVRRASAHRAPQSGRRASRSHSFRPTESSPCCRFGAVVARCRTKKEKKKKQTHSHVCPPAQLQGPNSVAVARRAESDNWQRWRRAAFAHHAARRVAEAVSSARRAAGGRRAADGERRAGGGGTPSDVISLLVLRTCLWKCDSRATSARPR